VIAGQALWQQAGHIEFTALLANLQSLAAIGETQAVLLEALLRFATEDIQIAQVELEVAQVVGGDLHGHGDSIAGHIAPGHHAGSTDTSSDLVGAGLAIQEVVAAQTASTSVIGLGLRSHRET